MGKFSGVKSERTVLSLEKEKENFSVVFAFFVKWVREIRKLHIAVEQRRLRNVQNKRDARAELLFC